MPALLYFVTALALIAAARRFITPASRGAALALVLMPLLFTGRTLLTSRVSAPGDLLRMSEPFRYAEPYDRELLDVATQMVPWRAAVRESLVRGEWPLLNPHTLCGDVLAAAAQPAAYSPFTLLAVFLDPVESFDFTGAIAFFLALLGAFLFARDLGCRETPALFGAAAFAFSGPLAFAILWPIGFSWALLPLVMLGARRVVRQRSAWLLTVAFVLEILAGHPESTLHVVTLGAIWGLFELMLTRNWRSIVPALVAALLALGITAVYLLPVIDAAGQTVEHRFRQDVFAKSKRAAPANEIAAGVLTSLFPHLHQQKWLAPMRTPAFIGIGSLVLAAAVAALIRRRDAVTWMLLGLFLFCAAAALMMPPVSSLLHALPLFDVTLNERLLFGASFAAAMLAAIGVNALDRRMLVAVLGVLAVGGLALAQARLTDGRVSDFRHYTLAGELLPLALAIAFPRRSGALLLLLLVQRVAEDGRWYPALARAEAWPPLPVLEPVRRSGDRMVGRALALVPNTSAVYGVDDVRGYEALTFRPLAETYPLWANPIPIWFNRVDDLTAPMLSMLNVRWAIVNEHDAVPDGWHVARAGLLENSRVLPRAFVPRHVHLATPTALVLPEMKAETDFGERAWIETDGPPREEANGPGVMAGGVAIMQNDGFVVISQAAWRGWRAYVDGRRATVFTANHAFLAVHLPRGRHTLRLKFLPPSFVVGRAISGLALLLATVLILVQRRRGTIAAPDDAHSRRIQQSQ
jgi:hypothetical protein